VRQIEGVAVIKNFLVELFLAFGSLAASECAF
jgi:hypothetical protein